MPFRTSTHAGVSTVNLYSCISIFLTRDTEWWSLFCDSILLKTGWSGFIKLNDATFLELPILAVNNMLFKFTYSRLSCWMCEEPARTPVISLLLSNEIKVRPVLEKKLKWNMIEISVMSNRSTTIDQVRSIMNMKVHSSGCFYRLETKICFRGPN